MNHHLESLQVFAKSLTQDFGINRPKIAVLGLNPHSGDGGLIGRRRERNNPSSYSAIDSREESWPLAHFLPTDSLDHHNVQNYDGVLAMYHDQGLAPFKALVIRWWCKLHGRPSNCSNFARSRNRV